MKQKWKEELRNAFEPPAPLRKKEFLVKYGRQEIRLFEFVLMQAGYIRARVWLVFALVFFTALAGAVMLSADMVWEIAALTPLLALAAVLESVRSGNYGMEELEMATRFSLKSVVLARLGILGTQNLFTLCLLLPLGLLNNRMDPVQAGAYMVMPFLLTTWCGLCIVRRIRGREGMYLCVAAAACISLAACFFWEHRLWFFRSDALVWWLAAGVLLIAGITKQYSAMVRRAVEIA